MKIAIRGHKPRGRKVIQILESLGGKNTEKLKGTYKTFYYINSENEICDDHKDNFPPTYKLYTLEEFEKEFPFKVGDKVTIITNTPYKIVALEYYMGKLGYKLDNGLNYNPKELTPYKEMKEERNITLTLDKAKEWYNKSGELKEIALQAFTEEELTKAELPKTWEEYIQQNFHREGYVLTHLGSIAETTITGLRGGENLCPSKKSAEAHLAMIQLEQLRDCYRGLFVTVRGMPVWSISIYDGKPHIFQTMWGKNHSFLTFQSREVAEEYLKNFKPLIEKAGDLI